MPEWVQTLVVTLLSGVISGAVVAVVSHHVAYKLKYRQSIRERIHRRYADLIGVCSDDLHRAKAVEAALVLQPSNVTVEYINAMQSREDKRHKNRRMIASICSQINLDEQNEQLRRLVDDIKEKQPYIHPIAAWGQGNFNDRFDQYQIAVESYKCSLESLVSTVRHEYKSP